LVNVQFNVKVPDNFDNLADNLSGISGKIFATTVSFFSGIISMVIVFALVFYMTVREDGIKNFIVAVVPKKYEGYTISLVVRIKNKIGKWMQGQIVVMLAIFVLDFIWLSLLGIPYAFILVPLRRNLWNHSFFWTDNLCGSGCALGIFDFSMERTHCPSVVCSVSTNRIASDCSTGNEKSRWAQSHCDNFISFDRFKVGWSFGRNF